jgi:hypothetical protein
VKFFQQQIPFYLVIIKLKFTKALFSLKLLKKSTGLVQCTSAIRLAELPPTKIAPIKYLRINRYRFSLPSGMS